MLAAAAWALGLRGTDVAAQVYRASLAARHGLPIWDPGWYGGFYPLSYSLLAPPLVAALGAGGTGVVSAAGATWAFDATCRRLTGGRRSAGVWYFASCTLIAVGVGQLTYLAGEAVALAAVAAAVDRRRAAAGVGGVVAALTSPLAAAFAILTGLVLLAGAALRPDGRGVIGAPAGPGSSGRSGALVWLCVGAGAAVLVPSALLFPGDGPFPFAWTGMAVVEALCALVVVAGDRRALDLPFVLRAGALAYGLATLAAFVVADPVGGNATRLAESAGLPAVLCALGAVRPGRRRALAVAALVPFAVWQWAPATAMTTRATEPASDRAGFYRPLHTELVSLAGGRPIRVEVVPTADHEESAALPSRLVSLARGWERQLDVARDPVFYRPGALDDASYLRWLRGDGVGYVALARAPLDYAGRAEAALLRAGVPGLVRVWSSGPWTLWRVGGSPGLVSGPAVVTSIGADRVVLEVTRAATVLVRARWTRYWTVRSGWACVAPAPGGWTRVEPRAPGRVTLGVSLLGTRDRCPLRAASRVAAASVTRLPARQQHPAGVASGLDGAGGARPSGGRYR